MREIKLPVLIGVFTAFSVVLGVLENFIPTPIPAVRLGLANLPIMLMLFLAPIRYAFLLMILKSFLVPIFSGSFLFKLSLGFPSTAVAFIVMVIIIKLLKNKVTAITVGVSAAFVHMFTQLFLADTFYIHGLLATNIIGVLLLLSTFTGIVTGVLTNILLRNKNISSMLDR